MSDILSRQFYGQKSFMISLTKNLLKILNNNKKPLILPNKTKTP